MLFTLKECFKMSCGGFVSLTRLNYISQSSFSCWFPTGEPQGIPLEDLESRKEAASILYFGLSKVLTQPCWLKAASTSALALHFPGSFSTFSDSWARYRYLPSWFLQYAHTINVRNNRNKPLSVFPSVCQSSSCALLSLTL